jgi:L-alanine-DL-glutamate epimerase-like enolase superfamily enzyme
MHSVDANIRSLHTSVYRIPTDFPESDGTLEWDSTTLVMVQLEAANETGLGYTYASEAAATLIREKLKDLVLGADAMDIQGIWMRLIHSIRNLGQPGICANAIAALDNAVWDLKAKLLHLPLVKLLGQVRPAIPVYGSGGFTSYSIPQLQKQLGDWASSGIAMVKMKIGRDPGLDLIRVKAAREAIGREVGLFVDANGAYDRKLALGQAQKFADQGVTWFEEPVSSDDLDGLRLLRDRCPDGMEITAGEYGYTTHYFLRMLQAGAVDVIQPDATRCCGITGFMQVDALCCAFGLPLSAHTAPSIHRHTCCAALRARHLEYFHDHARIEGIILDGAATPEQGMVAPDLSRPGLGIELKLADAKVFEIHPKGRI